MAKMSPLAQKMADARNVGPRRVPNKVQVSIPTRGDNRHEFTFDFARLMTWTQANLVEAGMGLTMQFVAGTYVHSNRCKLVEMALNDPDVTHILWLDDDMRFPQDAIYKLLLHHVPIVGANYPHRIEPLSPVAIKQMYPPLGLHTTPESRGLESVEVIGFGVCLMERQVFEKVPFPWFEQVYDRTLKTWVGEDSRFCIGAREAGYTVWVDHDISKEVQHMGMRSVTHADSAEWLAKQVAAGDSQIVNELTEPRQPVLVEA